MWTRILRTNVWICVLAAGALLWCVFATGAHGQGTGEDVCQVVPGDTVAKAVQGRLVETRAAEARCLYVVAFPEGGEEKHAFVVYHHDAAEYIGLREAQEGEVTMVNGLGDEAVLTFDREAKRYWLLVVKRGVAVLQVSGDDPDKVRRVAAAALRKYAER